MQVTTVGGLGKVDQEVDDPECQSQYSVSSDHRFDSPLPLPADSALVPSNSEVNQGLSFIERSFPDQNVPKMIALLYNNIVAPQLPPGGPDAQSVRSLASRSSRRSRRSDNPYFEAIDPSGVPECRGNKKPVNSYGWIGCNTEEALRRAQEWALEPSEGQRSLSSGPQPRPRFNSKEEEAAWAEKVLTARAYCERGFGVGRLKEEALEAEGVVLRMDNRRYRVVSGAVFGESYRRLEQFLVEECGRNIKPLTPTELKALYSEWAGAALGWEEDEYLTWRKFVKMAFQLGSVSVFEQATVKLYIRIMVGLRGRVGAMRLDRPLSVEYQPKTTLLRSPGRFQHQRLESETFWTAEIEADLIEAVAEHSAMARARDALRVKYGENMVLNNVNELKARLGKIIRIAMKRLLRLAKEYAHKVPLLVQLTDDKIKYMITHPEARQARLALARLYRTTTFNAPLLAEVIGRVNEWAYLEEMRHSKARPVREPAIHSVGDKIRHNLRTSRKHLKAVTTPAQRAEPGGELLFVKGAEEDYEHIVSLEHSDKLHYYRRRGERNSKGGFEFEEKHPRVKQLEMEEGDADSSQLLMLSDEDQ